MQTEKLKETLEKILSEGCITYTENRDLTCFYCGGTVNYNRFKPNTVNHEKTCVYVQAQQNLNPET